MTTPRSDGLPEQTHYQDQSNCSASPTCMTCPLSICKYDLGNRQRTLPGFILAEKIRRDRAQTQDTMAVIAARQGCSIRTVARALDPKAKPLPAFKVRDVHDAFRPSWGLSPVRYRP